MLSINIPKYSPPANYELSKLPAPTVTNPKDILIRVHAASINPIDVKKASGISKLVLKDRYTPNPPNPRSTPPSLHRPNVAVAKSFPYKIGYDCAGVVEETGSEATRFQKGDQVFVRLPECHRGAWSELAKTTEEFVAMKPAGLSMADAASIPLAAMTALQALRRYEGDLGGKTVFVPAGCMCRRFQCRS